MNYKESTQILKEIKKAKKILVNCHRGPDSDSVGSALAMYGVLEDMGKDVSIVCPDEIPEDLKFLEKSSLIKKTELEKINLKASFSNYSHNFNAKI